MVPLSLWNSLRALEKKHELSPVQRALLISDGSTTTLLEAFTGKKVRVIGREQCIIPADYKLAEELKIEQNSTVSKRTVHLINDRPSRILAYAVSHTPVERLPEGFRRDVISTDIPIGKILKKHKIETRREIKEIGFLTSGKFIFGSACFYRKYLIIHKNSPLMKIEEYFPADLR